MIRGFASKLKHRDEFSHYIESCMQASSVGVDDYALAKIKNKEDFIKIQASCLPFCSVHAYIDSIERKVQYHNYHGHEKLPMAEGESILSSYGVMGTVRHSMYQEYLGRGGRMIGDWVCTKEGCGKRFKFSTYRKCFCGSETRYEEISLQVYRNTKKKKKDGTPKKQSVIGIKIDGIYIDDDGDLWVIDYKFKTNNSLGTTVARKKLPKTSNLHQTRTYVALLRYIFRNSESRLRKVKGLKLVYVPFDQMTSHRNSKELIHTEEVSLAQEKKILKSLEVDFKTVLHMNDLAGLATERYLLKGIGPKSNELDAVVTAKPCPNKQWFDKHMDARMDCPYGVGRTGKCFKPDFKSILKQDVVKELRALVK